VITLERFAYLPEGTLGVIRWPEGPRVFTIERPWIPAADGSLGGEKFISCIPEGDYPLEWDTKGRIKNVPRLRNTNPRTEINIHSANWASELHGCIAPGLQWAIDGQTPRVINSRKAMEILLEQIYPKETTNGAEMLERGGGPAVLRITHFKCDG
jgi:hypothetical protein